jgi:ESF2/ABP1 family protein
MGKRNRSEHEHADYDDDTNTPLTLNDANSSDDDDDGNNNTKQSETTSSTTTSTKKKKIRKLKLTATEDFNAKLQKRGIVYLARVPPRMGPSKVKTLLSDFGPISRIYLAEEDKSIRKKRRKAGGSGGKRYTEGWVEFESKKVAKLVGETLNMSRIANQKGSIHYDDLWNIKYLKGFKWSHLTEKVAYERRVREQKLRVEMMEVRRENALYMAQVEAGKKLDHIEERRKKRKGKGGGDDDGGSTEEGLPKKIRSIRQKKSFEGESSATAKSAILGSLI